MATQTVKMVFQFRRAHTNEWLQHKDVVPAAGEPCFDLDLNILKIGDGIKTYEQLEPINGANLSADGKSIILEDGVFKLAGFDTEKVGAQPRIAEDGSLEWVVPSTEAIDTLNAAVNAINKDIIDINNGIDGLKTDVTDIKTIIGSADDGSGTILSRIDELENKMDGDGEGTVDAKIAAKINDFANKISDDGTVNTLKELVDYVANNGGEIDTIVTDLMALQQLVGGESVSEQIEFAIKNSGHMSKTEAEDTLLSKVEAANTYITKNEAKEIFEHVKYEIADVPVGTLIDYRDKEIRVMVPEGAQFTKQAVGAGGDVNNYYCTFKTYAPNDKAVGYIEHLNGNVDKEILTNFSVDKYGRRYQPTWLSLANYNDATGWTYYGKNSTANKYVGYDYQIDWYDANGVVIGSDKIRINLSNESCHNNIEPFYMKDYVKGVKINGTLLDMVDGVVDITIEDTLCVKSSDEIDVAEDGTLSIKKISFDKIVQDENTVIVMDGGSAV